MLQLNTNDLGSIGAFINWCGLSTSRSDADRLVKSRAVEINGQQIPLEKFWLLRFHDGDAMLFHPSMTWINGPFTFRVGKKWLRVR